MPGSIEILCQINYAAKQGYVRLRDALPRISQVIIFNVLVSRTADPTAAEKFELFGIDKVVH